MSIEKLSTAIRKEQIVNAALSLVASGGIRGLSIAKVAKLVGLVPSAIYRHFPGREDIIDAAIELIKERLHGNVAQVCEETPDADKRLKMLLARHVQTVIENRAFPRILFSDEVFIGSPERKEKMYALVKGYIDGVATIIQQGQQDGIIRADVDKETAAVMFLGIVQPAAILWHLSNEQFNISRHTGKAWKNFSDILFVTGE